jgi:hypothetical protein
MGCRSDVTYPSSVSGRCEEVLRARFLELAAECPRGNFAHRSVRATREQSPNFAKNAVGQRSRE